MDEREAMFDLMSHLKPALVRAYGAVGFNYAWNEGPQAGQTVPHVHIHFVPRRVNDKQELGFDPKDHFYVADIKHPLSDEELLHLKTEIQAHL